MTLEHMNSLLWRAIMYQVLEDDNRFIMGHVLVAASQCLAPMVHQDSVDAAMTFEIARALSEDGESADLFCSTKKRNGLMWIPV